MADVNNPASVPNEDRPQDETPKGSVAQNAGEPEAAQDEDEAEPERRRLGGWQRRIQKLERENEQLREIALNSTRGKSAEPEAKKDEGDKAPEKPKLDSFKTWEEYEAAKDKYYEDLADYKVNQAVAKSRTSSQQESEAQRVQKGWEGQVEQARKSYADFDEVAMDEDVPVTPTMAEAIITSEHGAEIAYLLGADRKEAERISKLPAIRQVAEIGKLEIRFARDENAAPADKKPEKAPEPPAAQKTKAPPPPQRVQRTSSSDNGELRDDLDPKEWKKRFDKKMEAARA